MSWRAEIEDGLTIRTILRNARQVAGSGESNESRLSPGRSGFYQKPRCT